MRHHLIIFTTLIACHHPDWGESESYSSSDPNEVTDSGEVAVCGDEIVQEGEECDGEANCWHCFRDRRVFVTREGLEGGFGSIEAADAQCQIEADLAGIDGTFLAWIASDTTTSPQLRFHHHPGRFVAHHSQALQPMSMIVAYGWEDFTDGTLSFGINVDAQGHLSKVSQVSTAVWPNGWATEKRHCNGWTSNDPKERRDYGLPGDVAIFWSYEYTTAAPPAYCTGPHHFYCVEQ